ncbi:hypothetical protein EB796_023851 [Bugula neritina]|uniref:HECT domain-containing protein n=2 Tax=Bugula neritina TaxID=10212 RepID=A0A7J7IV93_BUGNE|nr:hypothetical protein EB796_023851 [Bugula neritina]
MAGNNVNRLTHLRDILNAASTSRSRRSNQQSEQKRHCGTFCKEICLLPGPSASLVPVQAARLRLHQRGHIVQGVDIPKHLDKAELISFLAQFFKELVPNECVCKIMISCGKFLVEPNLPATEELTSLNLHKVMKSSKTIYLQPDSNIIWQPTAPIEVLAVDTANDREQNIKPLDEAIEEAVSAAYKVSNRPDSTTKEIVKEFVAKMKRCDGRALDIVDPSEALTGKDISIYIDRNDVLETGNSEVTNLGNEFDPRLPLSVTFYGETAVDYGGPRKEFFALYLQKAYEQLVTNEHTLSLQDPMLLGNGYYALGVIMGLSLMQAGPTPCLINSLEGDEPHLVQLRQGLKSTGVLQLMNKVPHVLKHMTEISAPPALNITRFVALFEVKFSPEGSSKSRTQRKAYSGFVKYLREAWGGRRADGKVTLEKILKFTTGAYTEPFLGFSLKPSIVFVEADDLFPLVKSSTCANILFLPYNMNKNYYADEKTYEKYDISFLNEYFGNM